MRFLSCPFWPKKRPVWNDFYFCGDSGRQILEALDVWSFLGLTFAGLLANPSGAWIIGKHRQLGISSLGFLRTGTGCLVFVILDFTKNIGRLSGRPLFHF